MPSEYRDALQLEKGAQVPVLRLGGALLLIPEQKHFRQLCDRIAGAFSNVGITEAGLLATLPEARQRVFERRYPALAKSAKKRRSKVGKKKSG